MLSNFYKTTSERWWRTPGTQKGSPIFSKGGRTKYKDKNRNKGFRNRDPSWGERGEEGEVYTQQKTLSWARQWGALGSQRVT